jgi:hypothetical protein
VNAAPSSGFRVRADARPGMTGYIVARRKSRYAELPTAAANRLRMARETINLG